MPTISELKTTAIELNNQVFDFIKQKDHYNSSHWKARGFYNELMGSLYNTEQELLKCFNIEGEDLFKNLTHRIDVIEDVKFERVSLSIVGDEANGTELNDDGRAECLNNYLVEMDSIFESLLDYYGF